jgi:hypothetical protein
MRRNCKSYYSCSLKLSTGHGGKIRHMWYDQTFKSFVMISENFSIFWYLFAIESISYSSHFPTSFSTPPFLITSSQHSDWSVRHTTLSNFWHISSYIPNVPSMPGVSLGSLFDTTRNPQEIVENSRQLVIHSSKSWAIHGKSSSCNSLKISILMTLRKHRKSPVLGFLSQFIFLHQILSPRTWQNWFWVDGENQSFNKPKSRNSHHRERKRKWYKVISINIDTDSW